MVNSLIGRVGYREGFMKFGVKGEGNICLDEYFFFVLKYIFEIPFSECLLCSAE